MKNLLFIILMTISLPLLAQGGSDSTDQISISVITPAEMDGLNASQISKLDTRLQQMIANHGISGEGYFALLPKFEIYDHTVVEGMRNIHLMEVELNLEVKELRTGKIYNTYSQSITGDGYSKNMAIDKSISEIKTKGTDVESFLTETKQKIMDYYRSNCDQIYSEANTLVNQKRYREAIALLYPVPRETGDACYNKVQKKLDEAYAGYMNETCEENLVQAKNAMEKNDNESALEALAEIDPDSNCYSSAQELNKEVGAKVGVSYKDERISSNASVEGSSTVVKKRKRDIKLIAEAQYRSRHQMEMSKE